MSKKYSKELPNYTKGEELFNAISHIVGGAFGVFALIIGLAIACIHSNVYGIVSMAIYGTSMILLYTMSAIYHFLRKNKAKKVFRIFDHCTIFLLIAGTYTPFCLVTLRNAGAWGWSIFFVVWICAILGIIFNAINMHKPIIKVLSMICYLAMGWCVVIALGPLLDNLPFPGFIWLLAGGLMYTIGVIFYVLGSKKKYIHSVWHLFCLAGTILQFISILLYVLM
jgi:hemolysin III